MMECGTVVIVMVDERCLAETAQLRWLTCHAMVSPQSFNTLIHGLIPRNIAASHGLVIS
jgi:hypothetical protein